MPSLTAQVYARTLLLLFFTFTLFAWFLIMANYNKGSLLQMSLLTLHISFGRSMLIALMALLKTMLCPIILMSWAIIFLLTPKRWVLLSLCSFLSSCYLSLFRWLTLLSLNCSPPSKNMRSWYGWQGISCWRWPTIQRACTTLEEMPTQAVVMMMTVVKGRIRKRLLATNQGKCDTIDYLKSRHIGIEHKNSFVAFVFISFSRYLNLVWVKGLYLRTSF